MEVAQQHLRRLEAEEQRPRKCRHQPAHRLARDVELRPQRALAPLLAGRAEDVDAEEEGEVRAGDHARE